MTQFFGRAFIGETDPSNDTGHRYKMWGNGNDDCRCPVVKIWNVEEKMETTQNFHENKLDKLNNTANMALTFQTTGSDIDTNMRQVMQGTNPLV